MGDKLDRFIYLSGDLACAVSHETITFLSNEGQLNQIAGMFSLSSVLPGSLGLAVNVLIILTSVESRSRM